MEKEIKETMENQDEMELQTTFNEDGLDVLVDGDDCTIENKEEVIENANENE